MRSSSPTHVSTKHNQPEVTVLTTVDQVRQWQTTWQLCLERSNYVNSVYNDPEYLLSIVESGGHDVRPLVVVVGTPEQPWCVAPFQRQASRLDVRLSVFKIGSLRTEKLTAMCSEFVFAADADVDTCLMAVAAAIDEADVCDLVSIEGVREENRLYQLAKNRVLSKNLKLCLPSRQTDVEYQMNLGSDFDAVVAHLGKRTRSSLRRAVRKISDANSQFSGETMAHVTGPEQVPEFLRAVDTVFQDSWQAGTYGYTVRSIPSTTSRYQRLAQLGWLRCYLLFYEGQPVAFQIGLQYQDVYHANDFGFARAHTKLSPGSVLMYLMLEDLCERQPPRTVDLGIGDSGQKKSFRATPTNVQHVYLVKHWRLRIAIALQQNLDAVERVIRSALVALGADVFVRRILKRKSKSNE